MKFQRYSNDLYSRLSAEVDYPINYHITGSVRLAHSDDRMDELRHVCGMARAQGLDFEMLSPGELEERYPHIELDDLKGALWDPYDGDIDPSQTTQAFAKGARDNGAEIYRFNPVESIERAINGEWLVHTKEGTITTEIVINAAGYRGGEIGAMLGLDLPIVTLQHQYLVTESIKELADRDTPLPLLRDPDISYYLRQERDGLILGPYEWGVRPEWLDGVPSQFAMDLYPEDLDRLEWYIEQAIARVPILGTAGVQRVINGPIPYTPDGNPLIGPAYPLENFYHCCAFSFGICQAGAAGKVIAETIIEGEPEWDMWMFDPRRYTEYATKDYTAARAIEVYQNEYAVAYPFEERPAGRPAKTTPLYDKLKARGAMFGARGGWERATWFVPDGMEAKQELSFHRTNWFDTVGEECRAVRERVGVLDLGGFAKYDISGADSAAFLDRLIAGKLPREGRISLSYFCTPSGRLLSEVTITRLAEGSFYLCSAAAAEWHDHHWIDNQLADNLDVSVTNVTTRYGTLILAGPRARDVLSRITEADLSTPAFPWLSAKEIVIGFARVLALRINYVGELGWELHIPSEQMSAVYDRLIEAGAESGIKDFGMYALDSLRLEKCYRAWKVELTHEYTPFDASLERFVQLDKPDFIGRAALLNQKQQGAKERLVPLIVETENTDAPFCASVFKGDELVGLVTSGGYGHAVQKSIALAYVRTDLAEADTRLEVEILGNRCPAVVATEPIYDPQNERLRA